MGLARKGRRRGRKADAREKEKEELHSSAKYDKGVETVMDEEMEKALCLRTEICRPVESERMDEPRERGATNILLVVEVWMCVVISNSNT